MEAIPGLDQGAAFELITKSPLAAESRVCCGTGELARGRGTSPLQLGDLIISQRDVSDPETHG
jgi:hypothetical protein